jgi:ribonuclease HI
VALVAARGRGGIKWHYVRGHNDIPGNERADAIAVAFAAGEHPGFYEGPLKDYPIDIHAIPADTSLPARRDGEARAKNAAAYSYLSLVGGIPMRHANWADCERRVKGVSGAKFKKSTSADDETAILRAWGVTLP